MLAYSLVTCTCYLYYQAALHCGFKIEVTMQPFKPQEKWQSAKINRCQTRNKINMVFSQN